MLFVAKIMCKCYNKQNDVFSWEWKKGRKLYNTAKVGDFT